MRHYIFEFAGEAGRFRSTGQNHNGDSYTIVGNLREDDNTTRVTFNKTYMDPPFTLCYDGTLNRQLGILSGEIRDNSKDSERMENNDDALVDEAHSHVRTFSFKHVIPHDLRKSGPPVYIVDPEQARKWCMDFLVMRELFEPDTNAGEQLIRVLSPAEYRSIQSAFESDSEVWNRVSYHRCVPFPT
jgi:hypothetical protein